jgi:CBS-domain-containing membrane protein
VKKSDALCKRISVFISTIKINDIHNVREFEMTKQNYNGYLKYIIDISDDDIFAAMKEIDGYIDITLNDFKELYLFTCNHAAERIINSITAKDVMTKEVISVNKETPLEEIAAIMEANLISGIPVIQDNNKVIGVISEKDFLFHLGLEKNSSLMGVISQCLGNNGCLIIPIQNKKAGDIMTSPPVTVKETTPVAEIMGMFTEKKINRVPVLNEDGELVGIVSRGDAMKIALPGVKNTL